MFGVWNKSYEMWMPSCTDLHCRPPWTLIGEYERIFVNNFIVKSIVEICQLLDFVSYLINKICQRRWLKQWFQKQKKIVREKKDIVTNN